MNNTTTRTIQVTTDVVAVLSYRPCHYCYEPALEIFGEDYNVCGRCHDINLASDLYKDEYGFRPRHMSEDQLIEWLRLNTYPSPEDPLW